MKDTIKIIIAEALIKMVETKVFKKQWSIEKAIAYLESLKRDLA